jgi:EmrB/QacA subfamily drug resistance transporter
MAAAAPAAAAPESVARPRIKVIFGGLMLVVLLAALDQTIVATALPTIVGDLGGLDRLAWVTSAFLLAQTAVTPIYGKLGDLYGRKRVLQSAIVLFLAGSALCGQATGMTELIGFRAVQGLGAGGLIVLAQAVIGDVVSPRERGRYQGLFGAVFGVASIAGPLLGGVIVTAVSWRWIFYINLPVGIAALFVLGVALPAQGRRGRPSIDYLGAALLATGLSAIVLVTSLGGTTWGWGSAQVVLVGALGVGLIAAFVFVERHVPEPILPPSLMRDRVFAVAGSLSLIVGFALFGAVVFLPLYFQTVDLASPTEAGLRLVPMILGLLTTSILSGQLISRTGRYRVFPIVGTLLMSAGLLLLTRLDVGTSTAVAALYLFVLGLGLGCTMQVLVLAVQNAVDYKLLGSATSGVTMLRGIGGSIGTAALGAVFTSRLTHQLKSTLHGPLAAQVSKGARLTGAQVARLPEGPRSIYQHAYVHSLRPAFFVAAVAAVLGFVLSLFLQERKLRGAPATSTGLEDGLAAPRSAGSLEEIERSLTRVTTLQERTRFRERVAERAGLQLSPGATWALVRIQEHGAERARTLAAADGIPPERVAAVTQELRGLGLLAGGSEGQGADGRGQVELTASGRDHAERLMSARCELLVEALADDGAARDPQVLSLLQRLSVELCGEPPSVEAAPAAG